MVCGVNFCDEDGQINKTTFIYAQTLKWSEINGPGQTRANRDGIRVRSYIPGSATDQARFGAQIAHGVSR